MKSRVFESLSQAESVTGFSKKLLLAAKSAGCPCFRQGNRIHEKGLGKWIAEHADELKAQGENLSLKDCKTNEEIRKLKLINDAKEQTLISRASVKAAISQFAQAIKPILTQKLENEYPSLVVGADIPGARVYGKRLNDQLVSEIQKFSNLFEI